MPTYVPYIGTCTTPISLTLCVCTFTFFNNYKTGDHSLSHTNDLRTYLAQFGLGGTTLPLQVIGTLSGGQKCRVALALALYRKPHFLIFDEPTNHLDLETSSALVKAIMDFKGGVLVVSHDEYLLEKVCKDVHVVKQDGGLHRITGGIKEYKRQLLKNKR
jgi:ATP-binding cassette subfamily F protein 3